VNYARRQQYRRLARAIRLGLASAAAALVGLLVVAVGSAALGLLLLAVAAVLGLRARRWLSLARRGGVGARAEDEVRRALATLQEHGWRLRHGLHWQGQGDIDSVAIAPTGAGFAVEFPWPARPPAAGENGLLHLKPGKLVQALFSTQTKTRTYDERQLGRVREQARWLGRRRRRWCRRGAFPVLCVVRAAGVEHYERGVLVVSIDRLVRVLWKVADEIEPGVDAARRTAGAVERRR
jgi:hypothetical protein